MHTRMFLLCFLLSSLRGPRMARKVPPPRAATSPADTATGFSRLGLVWPGVRATYGWSLRNIMEQGTWWNRERRRSIDMFLLWLWPSVSQWGSISAIFWVLWFHVFISFAALGTFLFPPCVMQGRLGRLHHHRHLQPLRLIRPEDLRALARVWEPHLEL